MKTQIEWQGKMRFSAVGDSGHAVVMDAGVESGGEGQGARPTELLLNALAGCSGIDIVLILGKMRETPSAFSLEVEGERRETEPKSFTRIMVTYKVEGGVKAASLERAIRLSLEKYCSVSNSLRAEVHFAYILNGNRFPEADYLAV
ncbi:MAG: OsmC family protein [Negativicutes bacterium]|nr:OsmC family protein [Negativicutes bacterium]